MPFPFDSLTCESFLANFAIAYAGLIVLNWVWAKVRAPGIHVSGRHVFITGGSQGLGLSVAAEYLKRGALVTIVSRKMDALNTAKEQIIEANKGEGANRLLALSCDVTVHSQVTRAVEQACEHFHQPVHTLVACAGMAMPARLVDQSVEDIGKMMSLNFMGCVHAVKAVLPSMVNQPQKGQTIILVNSGCGLIGFFGYTGYCGSKWALRGFAEALRNELAASNTKVIVYYPPNMDTPGFAEENKTKPPETAEIEGSPGIFTPEKAAKILMSNVSAGNESITADLITDLLRIGGGGNAMSPNFFLDLLLSPLTRIIGFLANVWMNQVVQSGQRQRSKRT